MSLDVYLIDKTVKLKPCRCDRCGNEHEYEEQEDYFQFNTTHNLGPMADNAGIYEALWRPETIGITTAGQLIDSLAAGLQLLQSDPDRFKEFNPPNGWGAYEILVNFVENYLAACRDHPDALVKASR